VVYKMNIFHGLFHRRKFQVGSTGDSTITFSNYTLRLQFWLRVGRGGNTSKFWGWIFCPPLHSLGKNWLSILLLQCTAWT
jgi:hypothetical protein